MVRSRTGSKSEGKEGMGQPHAQPPEGDPALLRRPEISRSSGTQCSKSPPRARGRQSTVHGERLERGPQRIVPGANNRAGDRGRQDRRPPVTLASPPEDTAMETDPWRRPLANARWLSTANLLFAPNRRKMT